MAVNILLVSGSSNSILAGVEGVERAATAERAFERLAVRDAPVDVLVLPPEIGDPLEIAQGAHLLDRDLALVVVTDPPAHARVARALQFAPYLGEDVVALEGGDDERIAAEVADAAARAQARRRIRAAGGPAEQAPPAEQVLGQLLASAPAGVAVVDGDGVVIGWNQRAGEILGAAEEDAVGRPLAAHFPEEEAERLAGLVSTSAESGAPTPAVSLRRERVPGVSQFVEATAGPLTGRAGERGVMVVLRDLTEGKEAESRLRFLADATEILAESLDYEATLGRVARLAVPMLADWCVVDELVEGRLERVAVAAASEHKVAAIERLRREYPARWDSPQPAARALREGKSILIELPTPEAFRPMTYDERHFQLIQELDPKVALATPLVAHGETVGALTLAFSESKRSYSPADVELAEGLARRAALAIDRARLYRGEQEARVAAERAREREAFLAETTELLSSSLEFEETLGRIASRAVPRLADWCIVYVLDDDGVIRRHAVEHVEEAQRAEVAEQLGRFALDPEADAAVPQVIRTREPEFHPDASLELLAADVDDPEQFLQVLSVLRPTSWMCLPLVARGVSLGAISFLTTTSGRRYDEADLVLAEEVARRAALAVDRARSHRLEREARLAAEEAQERLTFLAEASTVLSSSLDYEETLEQLAHLAVPTLADGCVVDVLHEGRELRQVAVAHVDPRKEELVRMLEQRYPTDEANPRSPVGRALREAGTVFLDRLDSHVEEIARDETHLKALRDLGLVSGLIVPLVARGQTLGAITLLSGRESGRRYTGDDVALAEQLASRAALAVDNARLYGASREALRRSAESLARLESLLATAPIGLAFFDTDVRYALLNEALAEINGLPVEEHIGRRVADVLPDLDVAVERDLRRVIETGEPVVGVELAGVTRAHPGEWRHWIVSYYPVVVDGTTVGVGAIFVDITERKRAEEERAALLLREQEARAEAEAARERLTLLAEASRVLSSSLDYEATLARVARLVAGRLADWCSVYLVEDGRARPLHIAHRDPEKQALAEEILRRYPEEHEGPGLITMALENPQALLIEEIDDDLIRAQAVDDEHFGLMSSIGVRSGIVVSVVAHDEVVGVVTLASGEDSPRLSAADLALAEELGGRFGLAIDNARLFREAEARAQAARALATVGDGVVLVDARGVVRLWNPAAEAITGMPAADIVGRPAEQAIPGWADVARFVPVGSGPGPGGTRPQTVPLDLRGREAWLSFSAVGFEEGTVYTFRDLTEERRVEELKTEFVATASHELRTPLAAVYGAAMTLRRSDVELDDERRDILLRVIVDESDRLARIVNDILWASRVDAGEVDVRIEPFDAQETARRVVEAAHVHLASNVELELVAPKPLPPVAADEQKVSQVLANLVENAIKYSPDGGRVELRLEQRDGKVLFAVRDEGLGIPAGEQSRIFEKFYRLDPHLTRGVGGTGLGLYICRELVRRMNGRIWVASREGEGSTFSVELPVAERQLVSVG